MSQLRTQFALSFPLAIALVIWILIMLLNGLPLVISVEAIKLLPTVVSIYTLLHLAFTRWVWRWPIFTHWLVLIPDLQGTWKGYLQTTWQDPITGAVPGPIEMYLVIRQTLREVHITMFTKESVSYSDAAAFHIANDKGLRFLNYSYSNTPRADVRHRSEIHYGASHFRILSDQGLRLEGEYWTDRKTTGHMELTRIHRQCIDGHPSNT